jgi:hypothetical protein
MKANVFVTVEARVYITEIIIYTRFGYEVFCNLIGSLLAGY